MESIPLRNNVLSTRIINILSMHFARKNVTLSRWFLIIAAETLAVMLHVFAWLLIVRQVKFDWVAFAWIYWEALIAGIIVIFVDENIDYFFKITDEMTRLFASKENSFSRWKTQIFSFRSQVVFSLVFALAIFPTAYWFFEQIIGNLINFGSLILLLNLILIGNGFYWLCFLPGAAKAINQSLSNLNYFDLKNTDWIDQLSDVYQKAAFYASIIGIMIIFPIPFGPKSGNITLVTSGWLVLVWLLVLVPYVVAQSNISKLVGRERLRILTNLQTEITRYLSLNPTDVREKRLANLVVIYNKTLDAKSSSFSLNPQIVNSIIIPLFSFIIINYEKIVNFFNSLF